MQCDHGALIPSLEGSDACSDQFLSDPVDLMEVPQFTVNIALVHGNHPILGVVHTPCQQLTHWAVKGQGAYVRTKGSDVDKRISAAEFRESDPNLVVMGSSSHASVETSEFIAKYDSPKLTPMGSSLKFLQVAEGKAHVYPRMAPTSEWDSCASQVRLV